MLTGFFKKPPNENAWLIVGLGNPGEEYLDTRHNVGQMVVDRLVDLLKVDMKPRARGSAAPVSRDTKELLIAKPATFVNTSGPAVKTMVKEFNSPPVNLVVLHDDLDLSFAEIRVKSGGGSGGHRGLNSIITALGTDEFARVRIGIGRPPGRMDPSDFVLSPFTPKERPVIEVAVATAAEAALTVVDHGIETAMNRYNKTGKS